MLRLTLNLERVSKTMICSRILWFRHFIGSDRPCVTTLHSLRIIISFSKEWPKNMALPIHLPAKSFGCREDLLKVINAFQYFTIIFNLNKINMAPLNPCLPCAIFLNSSLKHFHKFAINSPWEKARPFIWKQLIPSQPGMP